MLNTFFEEILIFVDMRLIEEIISISMYFLVPVWIVFIGKFINKNTCWSTLDDCDHKNIKVNYKRLYYLRIGDLVISGLVQMVHKRLCGY